jgi:hypothetical protein
MDLEDVVRQKGKDSRVEGFRGPGQQSGSYCLKALRDVHRALYIDHSATW